jgi:hypothetical protein
VHGDICTLCCGAEREVTVECPFDCPYLQEARKHEHAAPLESGEYPNRDIHVTEEFLGDHDSLLMAAAKTLMLAAFDTPGTVDRDVLDALDALIRTQRTLESGVYYESRPDNALAGRIFTFTQAGLEEFRTREHDELGLSRTRDSDVLKMLVFLQRLGLSRNNGRSRGRAFLDFLRGFLSEAEGAAQPVPRGSSLIVP